MIKSALAACIIACYSATAFATVKPVGDTLFVSAPVDDPGLSYPFFLYKNRLDSIQKTVPLNYNEYVQKYIDIYASRKEQMSKVLGLSKYYFPIFEKSLKEQDIPDEIKFLSIVESSLDPNAVSRVGATGPWQFMYTTAKGYGLTIDRFVDERKDPVSASQAAAAYLKDAFNEFGDWLLAVASYNCGKGAVTRAIAKSGKAGGKSDFWSIRPFLPLETRNYVPAFIATAYIMNYYKNHDIIPGETDPMPQTEVIEVNANVTLAAIANAINTDVSQLSLLNPSYKKQRINGSPGSPKRLVIPKNEEGSIFASLYEVLNNPKAETAKAYKTVSAKKSAPGYVAYKVKLGDTLSDIAQKFAASVSSIKSRNRLKGSVIQPGMILKINKG